MRGLTVRWSLADAPADVAEQLGSQIIGSAPILVEPCEIVAIAEGADGFAAAPRAGS